MTKPVPVSRIRLGFGLILRAGLIGLGCAIIAGLILIFLVTVIYAPAEPEAFYYTDIWVIVGLFAPITGLVFGLIYGVVALTVHLVLSRMRLTPTRRKGTFVVIMIVISVPLWLLVQPYWEVRSFAAVEYIVPSAILAAWLLSRYLTRVRPVAYLTTTS